MGRRNKSYSISLKEQINRQLQEMLRAGVNQSKREAILNDDTQDKIFSYNTYKTYWKHCKYFYRYMNENHPEVTTLKKARKYANEWLQFRANQVVKTIPDPDDPSKTIDKYLSAWTIQTEAKAINKLFGITPDDKDYFDPPKRKRQDIKRSRHPVTADLFFNEANNFELVDFCKRTGCRRNILEKLKVSDIITRKELENIAETDKDKQAIATECLQYFGEYEYFVYHRKDKGGRERFAPILPYKNPYKKEDPILARLENKKENNEEKMWEIIPKNADIHSYRAMYATEIYKIYKREIDDIPYDKWNNGTGRMYQSQVYVCRKDEKGKKLDKRAMLIASKALGHNRIEIVANNYIRNL